MPNKLIDKVVETCNIPREKAEELWSQAEEIAKKQYHLGTSLSGKDYAMVTGIFKKSLGKSCCQNLGWIHENQMSYIYNLILESKKKKEEKEDEKKKTKKKKTSKDEVGSDKEELEKDAAETAIADKSNEFPTEENKLIKSVFNLIEEFTLQRTGKTGIEGMRHNWNKMGKLQKGVLLSLPIVAAGGTLLYDKYKEKKRKEENIHNAIKTGTRVGLGVLGAGAGAYGIKKLQNKKQKETT